eukprot:44519-Prorocentrum_minimum.AAC.1
MVRTNSCKEKGHIRTSAATRVRCTSGLFSCECIPLAPTEGGGARKVGVVNPTSAPAPAPPTSPPAPFGACASPSAPSSEPSSSPSITSTSNLKPARDSVR